MAPQVILPREFDIDNVTFSDVKVLDNGGKIVYVSYNRAPLIVQTPSMAAPFGMSRWDGENGAASKYSMDLSFKSMDGSPSMQAFFKMLVEMDAKLIGYGFDNQQTWFKGKRYGSSEIVEALYTPLIKHAKDKVTGEKTDAYPPTFKATIPHRDGAFACDVYDSSRAPADLGAMETKGALITAIIQCTGVWFAGGKFGVSWKVVQMKVSQNSTKLSGYALVDEGDEVDSLTEDQKAPKAYSSDASRKMMMGEDVDVHVNVDVEEHDQPEPEPEHVSTTKIKSTRPTARSATISKPSARPVTSGSSDADAHAASAASFM